MKKKNWYKTKRNNIYNKKENGTALEKWNKEFESYKERIKKILNNYGITGPFRVSYMNFARRVFSVIKRAQNPDIEIAEILKEYEGYGLNKEILDEIVKLF